MKNILGVSALASLLLMPTAYATLLVGDTVNGKRLYNANCTGCHDTSVHSRKERFVQSLDALRKQLGNCRHLATAEFSASETQDLLKYLNEEFYKFR